MFVFPLLSGFFFCPNLSLPSLKAAPAGQFQLWCELTCFTPRPCGCSLLDPTWGQREVMMPQMLQMERLPPGPHTIRRVSFPSGAPEAAGEGGRGHPVKPSDGSLRANESTGP